MDGSTVHWKGTHPKKKQNETETNDRGLELDYCREGSPGLRQTDGEYSSWLLPLSTPSKPFQVSNYQARQRGSSGVQDLLLLDTRDRALENLPAQMAADCAVTA